MKKTTTSHLVIALQETMGLDWIAGKSGGGRSLKGDFPNAKKQGLAGPMSLIHPCRIQIIGPAERASLDGMTEQDYKKTIVKLMQDQPAAVILAAGTTADQGLIESAEITSTPLLSSSQNDNQLQSSLLYHLTNILAERAIVHGVFLEVFGIGVLLTGDSAVGKSELALELITRGHFLIADDTPEFAKIAPDIISGSCPPILQDFLEVRGLGLLNVRCMFGDGAIKRKKYLHLIIHLKRMSTEEINDIERLRGSYAKYNLLELELPEVTLPVAPGKELAILVEVAVRQHKQQREGYNAGDDFIQRQRKAIQEGIE